MTTPDESTADATDDRARRLDDVTRHPLRGPLVFGVVAATLELGALLWIMNC